MPRKTDLSASRFEAPQRYGRGSGSAAENLSGESSTAGVVIRAPLFSQPGLRWSVLFKRTLDLVGGGLLVLVFSPLFLLIPLLIKLDSRGPVFYVQERLGPDGSRIKHFKYRTMALDAEGQLEYLLQENEIARQEFRAYHKLSDDPRLTRIGRFLRRHSLDEIPQLWQVLAGRLSLVGPRAYLPAELAEMGPYADMILRCRPGLTGWWQVNGRNAVTFQERLALDMHYARFWSPRMELLILLKSVSVVITGQGA